MFEGLLQPTHLALILVIVLIIFGPGKLSEVGKALGQSVHALRTGASGDSETVRSRADTASQNQVELHRPVAVEGLEEASSAAAHRNLREEPTMPA